MLFHLAQYLQEFYSGFNVFNYLTLRAILGVLTALLISFIVGPGMIRKLGQYNIGQTVRDDGPESHFSKAGTPTMGGALILVAIGISTLLWSDLTSRYVWVVLLVTFTYGLIGWIDDYIKLVKRDPKGLIPRYKYLAQSIAAVAVAFYLYNAASPVETQLIVPILKNVAIPLGAVSYVLLTYFVIVGSSNAVNLTDGLDGLAILPTVMVGGALGVFAYLSGNSVFSGYLGIPYVPGVGELVIFVGALIGAGLGFLWFNTYPAQVFMGDVGALALGGVLGTTALATKQEILLILVGGLFVVEALSVILQVSFFKVSNGRRIFRMAPLHHHFELKGWPEPRVIVRFWIITVILVLVGLATLKIR